MNWNLRLWEGVGYYPFFEEVWGGRWELSKEAGRKKEGPSSQRDAFWEPNVPFQSTAITESSQRCSRPLPPSLSPCPSWHVFVQHKATVIIQLVTPLTKSYGSEYKHQIPLSWAVWPCILVKQYPSSMEGWKSYGLSQYCQVYKKQQKLSHVLGIILKGWLCIWKDIISSKQWLSTTVLKLCLFI